MTRLVIALSCCCLPAFAQAPRPRFEVASIKRCSDHQVEDMIAASGGGRGAGSGPADPEMLRFECRPLSLILLQAYVVYADGQTRQPPGFGAPEIKGGPDWLADRYTIDARPGSPTEHAMMAGPMMQALLEDRFHLKVHRESKEVPAFA